MRKLTAELRRALQNDDEADTAAAELPTLPPPAPPTEEQRQQVILFYLWNTKFFVTKTGRNIHMTPTCESIVGRHQSMLEACEHCLQSHDLCNDQG